MQFIISWNETHRLVTPYGFSKFSLWPLCSSVSANLVQAQNLIPKLQECLRRVISFKSVDLTRTNPKRILEENGTVSEILGKFWRFIFWQRIDEISLKIIFSSWYYSLPRRRVRNISKCRHFQWMEDYQPLQQGHSYWKFHHFTNIKRILLKIWGIRHWSDDLVQIDEAPHWFSLGSSSGLMARGSGWEIGEACSNSIRTCYKKKQKNKSINLPSITCHLFGITFPMRNKWKNCVIWIYSAESIIWNYPVFNYQGYVTIY